MTSRRRRNRVGEGGDDEDVADRPPWELGDEDRIAYNEQDGSEAVDLTGAEAGEDREDEGGDVAVAEERGALGQDEEEDEACEPPRGPHEMMRVVTAGAGAM